MSKTGEKLWVLVPRLVKINSYRTLLATQISSSDWVVPGSLRTTVCTFIVRMQFQPIAMATDLVANRLGCNIGKFIEIL